MEIKINCEVIMLPTSDIDAPLCIYEESKLLAYKSDTLAYHSNRHLYFVSNDEIKEGDWFLGETNIPKMAYKISKTGAQIHTQDKYSYFRHKSKKIIASTNARVLTTYKIEDQFLKLYTELQGNIKEVVLICYPPFYTISLPPAVEKTYTIKEIQNALSSFTDNAPGFYVKKYFVDRLIAKS